jgi:hypothetical protein
MVEGNQVETPAEEADEGAMSWGVVAAVIVVALVIGVGFGILSFAKDAGSGLSRLDQLAAQRMMHAVGTVMQVFGAAFLLPLVARALSRKLKWIGAVLLLAALAAYPAYLYIKALNDANWVAMSDSQVAEWTWGSGIAAGVGLLCGILLALHLARKQRAASSAEASPA